MGESSVFEPLVRGGSYNFQLPLGVGHPVFFDKNWRTFGTIDNKGNSFQFQRTKAFRAVIDKAHFAKCTIEMTIYVL